jgi:hypothetical protein
MVLNACPDIVDYVYGPSDIGAVDRYPRHPLFRFVGTQRRDANTAGAAQKKGDGASPGETNEKIAGSPQANCHLFPE